MKHLQYRVDTILNLCRGRDVLDIGSTGQTQSYNLWSQLKPVAKYLQGIDIEKHSDPDIIQGDMESHDFGRQFDVVVAGDVIEHVHNQGLFLGNIHRHLKEGGRLIITTPNAKWLTVVFRPNPTHTLWHDRYTLEYLLEQRGFSVEQAYYYLGNKTRYPLMFKPLIWRQGMLFIARPKDN